MKTKPKTPSAVVKRPVKPKKETRSWVSFRDLKRVRQFLEDNPLIRADNVSFGARIIITNPNYEADLLQFEENQKKYKEYLKNKEEILKESRRLQLIESKQQSVNKLLLEIQQLESRNEDT